MSYSFEQDFIDRKRQVRHYVAVVLATERSARLGASPTDQGRLLTLRAGTFLILYNLVEATMRAALEAIHDKITTNSVEFGQLNDTLRSEVVSRFKRHADPGRLSGSLHFPSAFVAVALDPEVKLSGNVDAQMIREFSRVYGFSIASDKKFTHDGHDLLQIKRIRNELAHGRKTFETIGRDHTARDLMMVARRCISYLNAITGNILYYLDNELYLLPS